MIIVSCLKAVVSVDILTASNTDVKLSETRTVPFSRLKSSSRFERTNKLDHDYSSSQISSLVCHPEKPRDIAFTPPMPKRMQRWRNREKGLLDHQK